ncbi:MAG: hypothetical protein EOR34_10665 [Mesorhizobium sp.]|uniref:hypothetical protein n=1 Tax=Mesorhizobium sp. TaxID=1871066 RepID=UPI000FE5FFB7|nr:hypothetical protein [Mesorhizobium sp.]RWH52172.1 MAG: hypothetical protein EOQ82_27210 [Mesorhizobium sp.]RWI48397.1 MAG: hypothetical protein EOR15_13625 [Mesorhizobium sp.]RWI64046.1 MAG: hypothetical protein EOR18_30295 [Mesorhizobium sp.]RWI88148.1 MAG: hypothetical protein EOR20_03680 [Mesorhizobium sp.]RWJ60094.1 MAG: hypothetical protein EOR32_19585 [Mesorhizobium sp.]
MGVDPRILLGNMRLVNPLDFQVSDVDFNVAIKALSRLPRYSGQTKKPYYVAEHEVKLYRKVPNHLRRAALLHDTSEGFGLLDIPNPVKRAINGYSDLEKNMLRVVFQSVNEPWEHMEELEQYDRRICADEMLQVFDEPWYAKLWEPLGNVKVDFWGQRRCETELRKLFIKEGLLSV